MPRIIEAIDQSLKLDGYLSGNLELPDNWALEISDGAGPNSADPSQATTSFNLFWKWFSRKVLSQDWISFEPLRKGEDALDLERKRMEELQEAKRRKDAEEARRRQWKIDWGLIVEEVKKDELWTMILANELPGVEQLMLTGNLDSCWPDAAELKRKEEEKKAAEEAARLLAEEAERLK